MKKLVLLLCIFTLALTACKKNSLQLSDSDYLVFGHFYGECNGDKCIQIYRLEKNQLLQDTKHSYPSSANFYAANYIPLSQQKWVIAEDLIDYFPTDLLTEPKNVIGQPDAGDWGGLYVEYNFNGTKKFWLIDKMKSNVPNKYWNFIDKINEKIMQLQ